MDIGNVAREIAVALKWLETDPEVVLAIVVNTWGSAPRRAGSMMIIRANGTFEGSVSGGCVEGAVITEAMALLEQRKPDPSTRLLKFSVASEQAWEVGLACGGEISVRLFKLSKDDMDTLKVASDALSKRIVSLLIFSLSGQRLKLVNPAIHLGKTTPVETEDSLTLPLIPALRLDIVGAVHIAQHLASMASECGFHAHIIDPRGAFSENRTFAQATIHAEWPDDFLRQNPPDNATAVVTLTHDPKLDDAALLPALASNAFYIGCLGSRKTHADRVERLSAAGMKAAQLDRINGPVGLDIGAATPAEIAVAILAQIIKAARQTS